MGRQILTEFQVNCLSEDILIDILTGDKIKSLSKDEEMIMEGILQKKIKAILCTVETAAYENIVKVVLDKLNLNDLFDNRQKYLN